MKRSRVVNTCWQTDEPMGTPGTSAPSHGSYASAGSAFAIAVKQMGNATTRNHDAVRPHGLSGGSPG
jgi:hypothetical protein